MSTGYDTHENPPFKLYQPSEQRAPFVLNSPHSGRNYRPEFLTQTRLGNLAIRKSEDFMVDELIAPTVSHGVPMLAANFPRAYMDANREPYELDPQLFLGSMPDYANTTSVRVSSGLGTIARVVAEGENIYDGKLSLEDGLERVETLYKPYHATLRRLLAETHVKFGYAILVDCHSMPSNKASPAYEARSDFVIGDRHGTACASELSRNAARLLRELGYSVEINKPYAGGFITQHYGRPQKGLHAIQIEINRGLYMDEVRMQKNDGFYELQNDLALFANRFFNLPNSGFEGAMPLAAE